MELKTDEIIFSTGRRTVSAHPILRVEEARKGKQFLYTIYYLGEAEERDELSFYYDPAQGGTIRFKNQTQMEWRRKAPG